MNFPRIQAAIYTTAEEREGQYYGQISIGGDPGAVVWESGPHESPTLALRAADDRLEKAMMTLLADG